MSGICPFPENKELNFSYKPVEIFFLRIFFMISENLFKKNIFLLSAVETLFLEIPSLVSHVV
jgi:hypothetical protein